MSSFSASVRRNQFGKTRKKILLHGTVKSAISDISTSLQTQLQSEPTLESAGQTSLILQRQLRGYKTLDPTNKNQKAIPENLSLHIYKRTNTHLNTAIGQLIAGAFSSACGHASTPLIIKGRTNSYESFRKGIYVFTENAENFPTTVGSSI